MKKHSKIAMFKGDKFGKLQFTGESFYLGKKLLGKFICECGIECQRELRHVLGGSTKSCGCYRKELVRNRQSKHNMCFTPTYRSWSSMKSRIRNPKKDSIYEKIDFCERWKIFENFLKDMGERLDGTTLDRIDNAKGYCPENCRWADYTTQANNRRVVRLLTYNGETRTATEWAKYLEIGTTSFYHRMERYKDREDLIFHKGAIPLEKHQKKCAENNEVLFHCVINGRPGIKKNSKQICFNRRTGKRFLKSSDRYEEWELKVAPLIVRAKKDILINFPINVAIKFFLKNHQWEFDLTNAYEGFFDIMQKCEILVDDKLIHSLDGSRKIFNDPNERIEITITRLKD